MLEKCAMNGAFYETYVSEIIKSYINVGIKYTSKLFYYRDRDKKECALIIEEADCIYPIEIKKGINPVNAKFNFKFLEKYNKKVMKGIVIVSIENIFPINEDNWYCPLYMLVFKECKL